MHILPAINAINKEEAKAQLAEILLFLPKGNLIHLDVVDGVFAPNITWGNPEELQDLIVSYKLPVVPIFELHMMMENPEGQIDAWLRTGLVARIIIHLEAMTDSVYVLEKCERYKSKAMLSINPGTDVERLLAHASDFDYFQILAVYPGLAGQVFKKEVLEKISFLRKKLPDAIIEVDGGINDKTARLCRNAGANLFVSASYILKSSDPKNAFEKLVSVINAKPE